VFDAWIRSACIGSFIGKEPIMHDEARGVIKEGYQVNDWNAFRRFVWNTVSHVNLYGTGDRHALRRTCNHERE
jgi:hypothetical protein